MKYGLSEEQLAEIIAFLKRYPEVEEAILFGSRAMDTYKEASDVDIAIKGEKVNAGLASTIQFDLEEDTYLPFFFDVIAYPTITNQALIKHIDTKGVRLFGVGSNDWPTYKLDELGILQRGRSRHRPRYAFHLYGGKYPFIQTGDIRLARKYIRFFEQTYSDAGLEQSKLWPKNTLCITIAANIAELAILSFDACFPDSVLGFLPDTKKTDVNFIYYTLTYFQRELKHIGEGSVQDNINLGTFQDMLFPIPSLPEQKAIANVLSSLDDKIDLLHRQNKTLEAMAETLFRQWFIEEAQDDWEEGILGDVVDIFDSKRIPLSKMERDKKKDGVLYPYYGAAQIMDYINDYIFDGEYVLFAEDGTVKTAEGYPVLQYATGKFWVNNHTHILKAKYPYKNFFIWNYLLKKNIEDIITGAVQPKISQENLRKIPFPSFPVDMVVAFNETTSSFDEKIHKNRSQIQTLEKLRDTLLPKLMSGEVRVAYDQQDAA